MSIKQLKLKAEMKAARLRNLRRNGVIPPAVVVPKPPAPCIQLPKMPEFITPDEIADNLTARESRETLRAIFKAIEAAPRTGSGRAIAAISEAIADAATWVEELMGLEIAE